MTEIRSILLVLLFLAASSGAAANPRFAGNWNRTSMRMTVTLDSWGENCGPEPKGYSSNSSRPVEILSQGKHLVFSNGGLRTDRCHSPNPRLQTKSENVTSTSWSRVCETAPNDPKLERGEYVLTASGDNQLDYTANTKVDWTLKGDHCVARLTERRVYTRAGGDEAPAGKTSKATPGPTAKDDAEPEEGPGCENPGEMRKLVLLPREITIGPGEKVCLKAYGVDADGCRFPVNATSWAASQGGQEVGGLLSRTGCFLAGETAADSEGTYTVSARFEGRVAEGTVIVAFPDLGDLLRARLDPSKEFDSAAGPASEHPATVETPDPTVAPAAVDVLPAPRGSGDNTVILIITVSAALVLAIAAVIVILLLRRRKTSREPDDDWIDETPDPPASKPLSRDLGPASRPAPPEPRREPSPPVSAASAPAMLCPKCGEIFPPGARFCPNDAVELKASSAEPKVSEREGMICPKCQRGYDAGAKFCPHDAEKLVPYPTWRSGRRGG